MSLAARRHCTKPACHGRRLHAWTCQKQRCAARTAVPAAATSPHRSTFCSQDGSSPECFLESPPLSPMLLPQQRSGDSSKPYFSCCNDAVRHTPAKYPQGALNKGPQHYRVPRDSSEAVSLLIHPCAIELLRRHVAGGPALVMRRQVRLRRVLQQVPLKVSASV